MPKNDVLLLQNFIKAAEKQWFLLFISFIRACLANEILKWVGCVGWGGSPRNCRWGCDVPFFKGDAIPDENMPFFIRLYVLVVPLKTIPDFRL